MGSLKKLQNAAKYSEEHVNEASTVESPQFKSVVIGHTERHGIVGNFCERPQQKAPYDSNIVRDILAQSERYKNLKPEVKFQILGERRKYGYLKKVAISHLEVNLKKQFKIFSQMIKHESKKVKITNELTHGIFNWSWNDFISRRALKNFVWVDVLLRMENNCLHVFKYHKDLEQIQLFLEKIFDGLFSNIGDENIDILETVEKPIYGAQRALHTTDYAENELLLNSKNLKHLKYKENFYLNVKGNSENQLIVRHLENRLWNSHIYDPIEVRYELSWFKNIVEQNHIKIQKVLEKYKAGIANYNHMLELETYIDGSCMDYCYSSIEAYKNRVNEIQNLLDKESDQMENKLIHLRLQIDKVGDQRKWLADEIERFHKEEEQMLLKIELEKDKDNIQSENIAQKQVVDKKNKKTEQKRKARLARKK